MSPLLAAAVNLTYMWKKQRSSGGGGGGGGTRKNFDRDARVTFLGLKFHNLFFWGVAQNESYFWGVEKISIIFLANWNLYFFLGVAEKRNYRITS